MTQRAASTGARTGQASSSQNAHQRRSYNLSCTIAQALDVLGDRWTLLILRDLISGLYRYNDILESCSGMSPNVLSDRLKSLEQEGLVERKYTKGLPPKVEYTLTEKGWSVRPILLALLDWGRVHTPGFSEEKVLDGEITTDFAVRVLPAFSFNAERAEGLRLSMSVEIAESANCTSWTLSIHDGHIHPRRHHDATANVHLKTTTRGFFLFVRGEARAEAVGELVGDPEVAAQVQSCFLSENA